MKFGNLQGCWYIGHLKQFGNIIWKHFTNQISRYERDRRSYHYNKNYLHYELLPHLIQYHPITIDYGDDETKQMTISAKAIHQHYTFELTFSYDGIDYIWYNSEEYLEKYGSYYGLDGNTRYSDYHEVDLTQLLIQLDDFFEHKIKQRDEIINETEDQLYQFFNVPCALNSGKPPNYYLLPRADCAVNTNSVMYMNVEQCKKMDDIKLDENKKEQHIPTPVIQSSAPPIPVVMEEEPTAPPLLEDFIPPPLYDLPEAPTNAIIIPEASQIDYPVVEAVSY
jgi:hypothetical protein